MQKHVKGTLQELGWLTGVIFKGEHLSFKHMSKCVRPHARGQNSLLFQVQQGACCVCDAIQSSSLTVISLRENKKTWCHGPSSHYSKRRDLLRNHEKKCNKYFSALFIYLLTLDFMVYIDMVLKIFLPAHLYLKNKQIFTRSLQAYALKIVRYFI